MAKKEPEVNYDQYEEGKPETRITGIYGYTCPRCSFVSVSCRHKGAEKHRPRRNILVHCRGHKCPKVYVVKKARRSK